MATCDLLDECSDMVLRCDTGREIPCIRFSCMTTCEAIRNVVEDATMKRDARGRTIVPFPGVDPDDLSVAIHILHGVVSPSDLAPPAVVSALRGMRALGHSRQDSSMMALLWASLEHASFDDLAPYVDDLLHTRSIRIQVLRRVVTMYPCWPEFCERVLNKVCMDTDTAVWMIPLLSRFFPAGPLFKYVLDAIPASVLDARSCLALFTAPKNAASYHPAEAMDVVSALSSAFRRHAWDDGGVLAFMQALVEATMVFDVSPMVANTMHGTIILLERTPSASLLLQVHAQRGTVSRRMAPWLAVSINWATGVVDARVNLDRLDDVARRARACQVRLTAYLSSSSAVDVWYSFGSLAPLSSFSLLSQGVVAAGDEAAFRSAVAHVELRRLRVDVFYSSSSVLAKAFF